MSLLSGLSHVREAFAHVAGEAAASDVQSEVQDGEE